MEACATQTAASRNETLTELLPPLRDVAFHALSRRSEEPMAPPWQDFAMKSTGYELFDIF